MRRALLLPLFLLLACATTADVRSEIQTQYDRLAEEFQRESVEGVLSFRTPDFNTTGPDGRHLSYAEMVDYTRNWFELNQQPIRVRFTVQNVEMHGPDEAAVTVFQEASRRQDIDGKLRTVEHTVTQRETWVRTANGWKVRKVDEVRDQKRWIDGERVK
jgi:hypothetical protein